MFVYVVVLFVCLFIGFLCVFLTASKNLIQIIDALNLAFYDVDTETIINIKINN